ncbi:MAG: anhydro-N-acetylmuramic acid kinase [Gemmatimonadaceae bacterium]
MTPAPHASEQTGGVYVGLMSGTSLDGVSAAVVRFARNGERYRAELLAFHSHPYTSAQRERMLAAMRDGSAREYCRLAVDFGGWLADAAVAALADAGVARAEVRAIGSHGQTLWHEPGHSTWQIDAPAVIAERTGIAVVSGFRTRDVAAGGQGAPLVSIADVLLFAGGGWRALQNIGGIGNVTIVPPDGTLASVRAFDTGPGVGVIDSVVRRIAPSMRFDEDGRIAAMGTAVDEVVAELLAQPYFAAEPPKSTGRELFDDAYVTQLIERCRAARPGATDADLVATAVSLTARSIADAYRRFMPEPVTEVLLSGGGAKNPVLFQRIADELAPLGVSSFDTHYFDGEAKESVAFALLALLHVEGRPGNVPTATGSRGLRILGSLTPA